ncbi:heavy-metal-associated domain-containing protein [Alkalihalobacterium elongatum]|uniref:heavy-metal-associated domain-containing protein n=1 Tax=Alkalihalobacterium elongatum TaxID=2675466 RepID=UPI001C200803|nr:heavy-metal-associated domain-containing protein [Alkalihalobacterium elongatum]
MNHTTLQVEKMSCGNCLETIEAALRSIDGVSHARAKLKDKTVNIEFDETKTEVSKLVAAIEEAGYIII